VNAFENTLKTSFCFYIDRYIIFTFCERNDMLHNTASVILCYVTVLF